MPDSSYLPKQLYVPAVVNKQGSESGLERVGEV